MRSLPRLAPVAVALALLAPAAAPAQVVPDVPIDTVDAPTRLSAYGAGLLYSKRDPATDRYRLMYTENGAPPAALPVASRSIPFDADLGPGSGGHFVAVYSRCAQDPRWEPTDGAPPEYTRGRGCDLYQFDLTSRTERRLVNASSPSADEVLPSAWRDRLAFARRYPGNALPIMYERPRTTGGTSRRMPGGPHEQGRPTAIDLYGIRLAIAWRWRNPAREGPASDLRLDQTRARTVTYIDRFAGGGLTGIPRQAPAFESGALYYARLCVGDPGGCPGRAGLVRVRYSTGQVATAPIRSLDLWQARGAGLTYVLSDASGLRACRDVEQPAPQPATCQIVARAVAYR